MICSRAKGTGGCLAHRHKEKVERQRLCADKKLMVMRVIFQLLPTTIWPNCGGPSNHTTTFSRLRLREKLATAFQFLNR